MHWKTTNILRTKGAFFAAYTISAPFFKQQ